jgi:hypothetical protein
VDHGDYTTRGFELLSQVRTRRQQLARRGRGPCPTGAASARTVPQTTRRPLRRPAVEPNRRRDGRVADDSNGEQTLRAASPTTTLGAARAALSVATRGRVQAVVLAEECGPAGSGSQGCIVRTALIDRRRSFIVK